MDPNQDNSQGGMGGGMPQGDTTQTPPAVPTEPVGEAPVTPPAETPVSEPTPEQPGGDTGIGGGTPDEQQGGQIPAGGM